MMSGKLKKLIAESGELVLTNTTQLADKSSTVEDFMKKLVGKKLKDLLDAASFSSMYVMNKYGIGSIPDQSDVQALVANLMNAVTAFINNRVLESVGKQRSEFEKQMYGTPEYKNWHVKRNAAFKTLFTARRNGNESEIEKAKKHYDEVMASDPSHGDYKKMMSDMGGLVKQFHNSPLTLQDVLPGPDDTERDKNNWQSVEKAFDNLKNLNMNESKIKSLIKNLIKEILSTDDGNYPIVTVQISTLDGTNVLLYKGNVRERDDVVNDINFKTSTKFNNILSYVRNLKSKEAAKEKLNLNKFMTSDRDVISILLNLNDDELRELETEKIVVTNNIPNEILDLTGKHIPAQDEPMYESEEHPDDKNIKWLEKRLAKYLPMDDYQRPALLKLLAKLKAEKLKKESGDPFRDIVKKNASLYRDSEMSRMDKEKYNRWLSTNRPKEKSLYKDKKSK